MSARRACRCQRTPRTTRPSARSRGRGRASTRAARGAITAHGAAAARHVEGHDGVRRRRCGARRSPRGRVRAASCRCLPASGVELREARRVADRQPARRLRPPGARRCPFAAGVDDAGPVGVRPHGRVRPGRRAVPGGVAVGRRRGASQLPARSCARGSCRRSPRSARPRARPRWSSSSSRASTRRRSAPRPGDRAHAPGPAHGHAGPRARRARGPTRAGRRRWRARCAAVARRRGRRSAASRSARELVAA